MKALLFRERKIPFGKKMKGTGEKVRVALFCGSQSKLFVQFGAVGQAAVDNRDDVGFGTYAQGFFGVSGIFLGALWIDKAHNVLVENIAQAVFLHQEAHFKPVAGAEGGFETHLQIGDHHIDAAVVEFGKFDTLGFDKLVSASLGVVLVHSVVDDALEVAFVVANAHFVNKNRLHFW